MKRMLSMLMALLLLVAPALAESATVEGDWELISLTIEGATYENLAQQGMVMTMRLEADGTGVQTVNGESYACTWTEADGRILIADSEGSMTYTLQPDGTLVGEDAVGDTMTFARVSTSVAGAWTLTAVEYEGVTISDPTTLNVEMDFLLNADGTGTLSSNAGTAACTWTQSGTSVTIVEENNAPRDVTLQSDGTLTLVVDGVTLIMSRTEAAQAPEAAASTAPDAEESAAPEAAEGAAVVSEYGFSVQLPQAWFELNREYLAQIIEGYGEGLAKANGIDESLLDQLAAANTSLYYSPDMSANFNVVRELAGDVTMDNFASLESTYQQALSRTQGITDFKLSGPVSINGNSYYVGTFTAQAGLEQQRYFCVANGYIYTLTLTNVSDSDAELIMNSFKIL